MSKTNYAGIDYSGPGSTVNRNPETGIRYGVIHSNRVSPDAFEEIIQNGTDEDYEAWLRELKGELRSALKDYFSDYKWGDEKKSKLDNAVENAFDAISDDLNYDSNGGDCTRYSYEKDGLKIQTASDGDMFVIESPFFTYAQYCSPCAPGACYLMSPLEEPTERNKCYCLPGDWFDDDQPPPYPIWEVATGKLVQQGPIPKDEL